MAPGAGGRPHRQIVNSNCLFPLQKPENVPRLDFKRSFGRHYEQFLILILGRLSRKVFSLLGGSQVSVPLEQRHSQYAFPGSPDQWDASVIVGGAQPTGIVSQWQFAQDNFGNIGYRFVGFDTFTGAALLQAIGRFVGPVRHGPRHLSLVLLRELRVHDVVDFRNGDAEKLPSACSNAYKDRVGRVLCARRWEQPEEVTARCG